MAGVNITDRNPRPQGSHLEQHL